MQSAVRGDLSRCVAQNLRARPSMGVQAPVDCKHVGWIVVDLKKNSSTLDEMTRGWTARVQSNPPRKRVCDALRSGSGDDPPGMDESAKGYVRRGQSLAVRDDQKVRRPRHKCWQGLTKQST